MSGPGGTGKSKVIHAVICYCKELCENAGIPFNKNTIVVTALTGAAAVSIFGETTHAACCLNRKVQSQDIDTWKGTLMVIIDEISFASEYVLRLGLDPRERISCVLSLSVCTSPHNMIAHLV